MCCYKSRRIEANLRAEYPDPDKEVTAYKVLLKSGKGDNYDHKYCLGVHVSTHGPGFHVFMTREEAETWKAYSPHNKKVVAVRIRMRDMVKAGLGSTQQEILKCKRVGMDVVASWSCVQVVVKRLRVDKREWKRAGMRSK